MNRGIQYVFICPSKKDPIKHNNYFPRVCVTLAHEPHEHWSKEVCRPISNYTQLVNLVHKVVPTVYLNSAAEEDKHTNAHIHLSTPVNSILCQYEAFTHASYST